MNRHKGFTLVEAAVAIGVVAILSGIIIPLVFNSIRDARVARARNDINVIAAAIANQMKDMGSRPIVAPAAAGAAPAVVTPGGSTGAGDAVWASRGTSPDVGGGGAIAGITNENSFENLFTAPNPQAAQGAITAEMGNTLFGLGAIHARDEFRYKGPYLSDEVTHKTDPWGRRYLILGYNANGQASNGPIWVVSAGASRQINPANLVVAANAYRSVWDYAGVSDTNIAVRVH